MKKNELFINKKIWNTFSEEEMDIYINAVFDYYKKNGFPYFKNDKNFRDKEFTKLKNYDFTKVIDFENKTIKQTMHGLSLAWSYMPHSWEIQCGNMKTPFEIFHNDETLKKVIIKRTKMGDNISDNGIRKMLKIFTGTQSVSNFRPTAAAGIYKAFCNKGDLVWDISSGFGGRLLGAEIAGVNYIGTDPSTPTYKGLLKIKEEYINTIDSTIHCLGSEDFLPEKNSLDFVFTSPPYFNWEKYTNENTQSFKKFPEKESWLNGYLLKTFQNSFYGLKKNAKMAINIANTKNFKDLEEQTILMAEKAGFVLVDTWKLALSNPNMKNKTSSFKYEPIFIFQKKELKDNDK
jgi:hypothetical protein